MLYSVLYGTSIWCEHAILSIWSWKTSCSRLNSYFQSLLLFRSEFTATHFLRYILFCSDAAASSLSLRRWICSSVAVYKPVWIYIKKFLTSWYGIFFSGDRLNEIERKRKWKRERDRDRKLRRNGKIEIYNEKKTKWKIQGKWATGRKKPFG